MRKAEKVYQSWLFLVWTLLTLAAWASHKALLNDNAFLIFKMLNSSDFQLQGQVRFTEMLVQLPPVVFLKIWSTNLPVNFYLRFAEFMELVPQSLSLVLTWLTVRRLPYWQRTLIRSGCFLSHFYIFSLGGSHIILAVSFFWPALALLLVPQWTKTDKFLIFVYSILFAFGYEASIVLVILLFTYTLWQGLKKKRTIFLLLALVFAILYLVLALALTASPYVKKEIGFINFPLGFQAYFLLVNVFLVANISLDLLNIKNYRTKRIVEVFTFALLNFVSAFLLLKTAHNMIWVPNNSLFASFWALLGCVFLANIFTLFIFKKFFTKQNLEISPFITLLVWLSFLYFLSEDGMRSPSYYGQKSWVIAICSVWFLLLILVKLKKVKIGSSRLRTVKGLVLLSSFGLIVSESFVVLNYYRLNSDMKLALKNGDSCFVISSDRMRSWIEWGVHPNTLPYHSFLLTNSWTPKSVIFGASAINPDACVVRVRKKGGQSVESLGYDLYVTDTEPPFRKAKDGRVFSKQDGNFNLEKIFQKR